MTPPQKFMHPTAPPKTANSVHRHIPSAVQKSDAKRSTLFSPTPPSSNETQDPLQEHSLKRKRHIAFKRPKKAPGRRLISGWGKSNDVFPTERENQGSKGSDDEKIGDLTDRKVGTPLLSPSHRLPSSGGNTNKLPLRISFPKLPAGFPLKGIHPSALFGGQGQSFWGSVSWSSAGSPSLHSSGSTEFIKSDSSSEDMDSEAASIVGSLSLFESPPKMQKTSHEGGTPPLQGRIDNDGDMAENDTPPYMFERQKLSTNDQQDLLLLLDSDSMCEVHAFLGPVERYNFLASPLSKEYREAFTSSPYMWQRICGQVPFNARTSETPRALVGNSFTIRMSAARAQYMSLLKCFLYTERVLDDFANRRKPALFGPQNLSSADSVPRGDVTMGDNGWTKVFGTGSTGTTNKCSPHVFNVGKSMITQRLHGDASSKISKGLVTVVNPNAQVYSWTSLVNIIVNWLSFYTNVGGIQAMCFRVLPKVLEDEDQRSAAHGIGVVDLAFNAIINFPDSEEIIKAALHTLVLMARPIGGEEGMMFTSSMMHPRFTFDNNMSKSHNGIQIILDVMKRFIDNPRVVSMACWSLVNISLNKRHKFMLIQLDGIQTVLSVLKRHESDVSVQYRGLFSLINLVIPNENGEEENLSASDLDAFPSVSRDGFQERNTLGRCVEDIVQVVVRSMRRHTPELSIINRGCLVLHNLSLTRSFLRTLLMTDYCVEVLKTSKSLYGDHDNTIKDASAMTLTRMYQELSTDSRLKEQFIERFNHVVMRSPH